MIVQLCMTYIWAGFVHNVVFGRLLIGPWEQIVWIDGAVQLFVFCFAAFYGLYAVFKANYRQFDIDVRDDKVIDEF